MKRDGSRRDGDLRDGDKRDKPRRRPSKDLEKSVSFEDESPVGRRNRCRRCGTCRTDTPEK